MNGTPPQAALADRQSGDWAKEMHAVFTDSSFQERKAAREKLPVIASLAVLQQRCSVTGFILKCDMTFQLVLQHYNHYYTLRNNGRIYQKGVNAVIKIPYCLTDRTESY